MTYSASRLTAFAVLSSIETDLRTVVLSHLSGQDPTELLGVERFAIAVSRRDSDLGPSQEATLDELLPYVDMGEIHQTINRHSAELPQEIAKYVRSITEDLDRLVPIRNRIAHSRPLNFDDLAIVLTTAQKLAGRRDSFWNDLRAALKRLRDEPSFVLALEIPAETGVGHDRHNLPSPDFDDTGFIGRVRQVKDLVKLCQGPYPVISIIGDGGLGKTATALKVAYDLLDLEPCPFEAIVWTTSKTMQLTATEIIRIEGAIQTSLGMMQSVAEYLAGKSATDAFDEVLAYLEEFRILLVLDNLETVLDERIRNFLSRLPMGSKVLITSRIGLGAFEHPVRLSQFSTDEAVQLLRALANIRGVEFLSKAEKKQLVSYCERMKNNPAWIKWFVSLVQTGRRPEDALRNPKLFLEFCMSNVYEFLDGTSRLVLQAMVSIPGPHTSPELAVLTELDPLELQRGLQRLLTTNMVTMFTQPAGTTYQTRYEVSELARAYLPNHHPVSEGDSSTFQRRWRGLVSSGERMRVGNPYSIGTIAIRNRGDIPVARLLDDALEMTRRKNYSGADERIVHAKSLSPDFSEVHRVEAIVRLSENNLPAANAAYEAAVDLDPGSAPLRFWYGGFLMRVLTDLDAALEQLHEARRLDPRTPLIVIELARAHMWQGDFQESLRHINSISSSLEAMSEFGRRKVHDLRIQIFGRQAESLANEKNYFAALSSLLQMREAFDSCPSYLRDSHMRDNLRTRIPTARTCNAHLEDEEMRGLADEMGSWLQLEGYPAAEDAATVEPEPGFYHGIVTRLLRDKHFGFLRRDDGISVFFHATAVEPRQAWDVLEDGSDVSFRAEKAEKGLRATVVRPR